MTLPYPANDLDYPEKLLALLGSFWSDTYVGTLPVTSVVDARGRQARQGVAEFSDLLAACGRRHVPVWRTRQWHPVRLLASQQQGLTWPAPQDGLMDVSVLSNRLTEPSRVLL